MRSLINNTITNNQSILSSSLSLASSNTNNPAIDFTFLLKTGLDIECLFEQLIDSAFDTLLLSSLLYRFDDEMLLIKLGKEERYTISYDLALENYNLGSIRFSSATIISQQNLRQIDGILGLLVYPLRNAIYYQKALKMALQDPLTKTKNRLSFEDSYAREIELAKRHQHELTLIIVDLDNLKKINDQFGHIIGDHVLQEVSKQINHSIRKSDSLFRLGGDEFVIILTKTNHQGALPLAERIRANIQHIAITNENIFIHTTASLGIATYQQGDTPHNLFQKADQALYQAKYNGKNCVFYLE